MRALHPPPPSASRIRLSAIAAWTAAILIGVSVISVLLATLLPDRNLLQIPVVTYVLALVALAGHYLARPDRGRLIGFTLYATAAVLVLVSANAGASGNPFYSVPGQNAYLGLLAYGAVLVVIGYWLIVAGRRASRFARSLRSPSIWVLAAGATAILMAIRFGADEWAQLWPWLHPAINWFDQFLTAGLLLLALLSVAGLAIAYTISARRLWRERFPGKPRRKRP